MPGIKNGFEIIDVHHLRLSLIRSGLQIHGKKILFFVDMRITALYIHRTMRKKTCEKEDCIRVAVRLPEDMYSALKMVANRHAITKTHLMRKAIEKECRRCRESGGLPSDVSRRSPAKAESTRA
ncbi:BrnA antitoxin family protein [Patescibacteria group bacterium]|nr:BrnA antitoxin family protein [Patescibacteria group bacterium]